MFYQCPVIFFHVSCYININMSCHVQAVGDMVYPIMFGGDKPGQDKADKLREVLYYTILYCTVL